jgi:hypothetical protein
MKMFQIPSFRKAGHLKINAQWFLRHYPGRQIRYRTSSEIPMTIHLIIFDCDGTLVDSRHSIVEAMSSAFASLGLNAPEPTSILSTVGLSVPEAIYRLVPGQDPRTVSNIGEAYKAAYFRLRSQPDFIEPFFDGAENALKVRRTTCSAWQPANPKEG